MEYIKKLIVSILKNWKKYASACGVGQQSKNTIQQAIEEKLVNL